MINIDAGKLKQRVSQLREDISRDLPDRLKAIAAEVSALQQLTGDHRLEEAIRAADTIAYLSHKLTGSLGILGLDEMVAASSHVEHCCRNLVKRPDCLRDPEKIAHIATSFSSLRQALSREIRPSTSHPG